jgi:putative tricarboxylic transport membrane protein
MSDEAYGYWVDSVAKVYASPEWKGVMAQNGLAPLNLQGADFQAFVQQSIGDITQISKEIGLIK